MQYSVLGKFQPSIWQRLLVGILTLLTSALGLAEWLALRAFLRYFLIVADITPWAWQWWDHVAMLGLGVVWLILVYLCGHLYQQALEKQRLWRMVGRVSLLQALIPLALVIVLYLVALILRALP